MSYAQCGITGKRLYKTKALAVAAAAGKQAKHGKPGWPYQCGYCGYWHLTSRRPR